MNLDNIEHLFKMIISDKNDPEFFDKFFLLLRQSPEQCLNSAMKSFIELAKAPDEEKTMYLKGIFNGLTIAAGSDSDYLKELLKNLET